jgi:hypothetical protein
LKTFHARMMRTRITIQSSRFLMVAFNEISLRADSPGSA